MKLTTEQLQIMAQFIADEMGGEADEYLDSDFVLTNDEFDHFDGRHWHSCSRRKIDKDIQFPNAYYDQAQIKPGQPRTHLWVVDFGEFRAVFNQ